MKVWWLLVWDQYYPSAALGNFHSSYATQEEAEAEKNRLETEPDGTWEGATPKVDGYLTCAKVVNVAGKL